MTQEAVDKEDVLELYRNEAFAGVITDVELMVKEMERAVLAVDLAIASDRQLAFEKARVEGARKIAFLLKEKAKKSRK